MQTAARDTATLLIVGPEYDTIQHAHDQLKKVFCSARHEAQYHTCFTCYAIEQNRHHGVLWLTPEKNYTREQLEPIFHRLNFLLDPEEQYYIVLQKADLLSASCANSLLKSLEEPPRGYHFMLLTDNPHRLLPTITSRCHMVRIQSAYGIQHDGHHQDLITLFTNTTMPSLTQACKALDTLKINDHEAAQILASLTHHWNRVQQDACIAGDAQLQEVSERALLVIEKATDKQPMPGSSKIFFKNLFLQLYVA